MDIKMRLLIILFFASCAFAKINMKALTESMGQEVIEIGAPIRELPPDIEEEPSAENEGETTTTDIKVATPKEKLSRKSDPTKKTKDVDKIDGKKEEDEEARIQKELADIYKDSIDYKSDSAEVTNEENSTEASEKPVARIRTNFQFQPDSNSPEDVARFRTSIDDINCGKTKLSLSKSGSQIENTIDKEAIVKKLAEGKDSYGQRVTEHSVAKENKLKRTTKFEKYFFGPDSTDPEDIKRFRTAQNNYDCEWLKISGKDVGDKSGSQKIFQDITFWMVVNCLPKMEHPAFEEAGQEPGLEIWTIDKFEPVAIEKKMYGKFYNGDSYIVLKTSGNNTSTLSYDVHFWLGSKTTQDKKGSAAILTITLDDKLGGRAVHHREVQGHETSQFMRYFQPAIRYLEGGNDSGFNEVETNAGAEKRLLKLTGCENMRIEEVPAEASSLTQDHCFILEVDHDIFVLMPEGAKATQRRKIISVANTLRDDYHNGRATIEIIDDFSSDDDFAAFFEALGGGSKEDLVSDESTNKYTRTSVSAVFLYKVLSGDEIELMDLSKPFKQNQLTSEDVFILDTPDSGVYIWLGKDVDPDIKKAYNDVAQQYLDIKEYPSWVNVTRVSEGVESSVFKQYFHRWNSVATTAGSVKSIAADIEAGYFSGDADDEEAVARFVGKSAAVRGYMPDEGAGALVVYRAAEEAEDITEQEVPKMYSSEVYVVKYQYKDENDADGTVAYLWIGKDANEDSKKAGIDLLATIEEEEEENITIVKLPQGKEIKHFLNLFKGNLIILCGDKDNEYKSQNFNGSFDDDGIRLFKVEGTKLGVDMRATQVEEKSDFLESDDVFILETPDMVYIWNGKESNDKEQEAAKNFATLLVGEDREVTEISQGDEPDEFWQVLGDAPEEKEASWKQSAHRRTAPPTLAAVSVRVNGSVRYEEMEDYSQKDLSEDGVFILDTGEELFVWLGKNIPERVKKNRLKIIAEYIADDGLERTMESAIVVTVRQGREPGAFKKLFQDWEPDYWQNQTSYEDMKNETKAANSK